MGEKGGGELCALASIDGAFKYADSERRGIKATRMDIPHQSSTSRQQDLHHLGYIRCMRAHGKVVRYRTVQYSTLDGEEYPSLAAQYTSTREYIEKQLGRHVLRTAYGIVRSIVGKNLDCRACLDTSSRRPLFLV